MINVTQPRKLGDTAAGKYGLPTEDDLKAIAKLRALVQRLKNPMRGNTH